MTKFFLSFLLLVAAFTASSQKKSLAQPDLPGDLLVDIGLNYWDQKSDTLKNWGSKSLGIYYNKRFRISKKLSFYAAAGLGFERYSFEKNIYLASDNGNIFRDTLKAKLIKNKLAVTYFDLPLEFRFHPKGTIEGEGFFLGVGAIPGLKMGSHTKLKYEKKGETRKEKLRGDFGLNNYRLGLQFRVGWKSVNFFYKTYLTEVFSKKQNLVSPDLVATGSQFNPSVSTFGINLSGF